MAVGWLRGFFSSAPVLGILRFVPRALELRKSFWGGLCFPVRFGEQQAAERGDRLYPGFFFWPQRLSALSESSQASENISFTRGVLRGFTGVLAQSVPLQEHDICLSLPCPPCLSADHSNSAESLSIFSFSHYFCTHLPPPVLFSSWLLSLSVASFPTPFHCI